MSEDELAHSRHTEEATEGVSEEWQEPAFDSRLGYGEYFKPSAGTDVVTSDARLRFLAAIPLVVPQVLAELERDVYPAFLDYKAKWELEFGRSFPTRAAIAAVTGRGRKLLAAKRAAKRQDKPTPGSTPSLRRRKEQASVSRDDPRETLADRAGTWADRFGIEFDWVFAEAAFVMMHVANGSGTTPDALFSEQFASLWGGRRSVWWAPSLERELPRIRAKWNPVNERWARFRAEVTKQFARKLEEYGAKVREEIESRGYTKIPVVHEPLAFHWLVERVVLRKSWGQIARKHKRARDSIRDATVRAAGRACIALSQDTE